MTSNACGIRSIQSRAVLGLFLSATASAFSPVASAVDVGYYAMCDGQGNGNQAAVITAAGHTPVNLNDMSASSLAGVDVAFVDNCDNGSYGAEYLGNLSDISDWVADGGVLIIHDRYVDAAETILPGGGAFNVIRNFDDPANINVRDNSTIVTNGNGPGGVIDDSSLDGGTSSSHGFTIESSIPVSGTLILSTGDSTHIVTFAYSYGSGRVIYSSIPLDYYISQSGGVADAMKAYAANVVAYAAATKAFVGLLARNDGNVQVIYPDHTLSPPVGTIPNGGVVGDCAVTSNGTQAFVSNFQSAIYPVDLSGASPVIGSAIATAQPSEDVAITPDNKFVLVSDGGGNSPVSVVDVDTHLAVSSFNGGWSSATSVDACDDNHTVIVGDYNSSTLFNLQLSPAGVLSNLVASSSLGAGTNAYCAPGSQTVVFVDFNANVLRSFTTSTLSPITSTGLGGPSSAVAAAFSPDGTVIYVRGDSMTSAIGYNPTTGAFSGVLWAVSTPAYASSYYGIDQIGAGPDGYVYLPWANGLRILDPANGNPVADPVSAAGVGVCFSKGGGLAPKPNWSYLDYFDDGHFAYGPSDPRAVAFDYRTALDDDDENNNPSDGIGSLPFPGLVVLALAGLARRHRKK